MKTQTQVFQPPGPALCSAHKHITLFFFFLLFIGVELIYNVVLISAEQQSDSVIHIYTSFFFFGLTTWLSYLLDQGLTLDPRQSEGTES